MLHSIPCKKQGKARQGEYRRKGTLSVPTPDPEIRNQNLGKGSNRWSDKGFNMEGIYDRGTNLSGLLGRYRVKPPSCQQRATYPAQLSCLPLPMAGPMTRFSFFSANNPHGALNHLVRQPPI